MTKARLIVLYITEDGNAERRDDWYVDLDALKKEDFNVLTEDEKSDAEEEGELSPFLYFDDNDPKQFKKELARNGVVELVSSWGDTSIVIIDPHNKKGSPNSRKRFSK